MPSRLTPEASRAAANVAVRALASYWSMRPEAKVERLHFVETLSDAVDSMLADRDHWNVGGVDYGDRLMVLQAMHNALNEHSVNLRKLGS